MNKNSQHLMTLFEQLSDEDKNSAIAFCEFLLQRSQSYTVSLRIEPDSPIDIPRPAEERVVAAIKRLSATYPMLKRSQMLHQTAGLMSEHLVQGRSASDVIDELEGLFQDQYKKYLDDF